MRRLVDHLVEIVPQGKSLLVFGSGHSALFPLELYHRAGGASFVFPLVGEYLMPQAGPNVVRVLERTPGASIPILNRAVPKEGEMLWISSQSGINAASVDMALEGKKRGLRTVAFTSLVHSQAVESRHPSGKRLFEVCDEVVDLGGRVGDACVEISPSLFAGPLSTLGSVFLGHSIVVAASVRLEGQGHRCVYTSVNTPEGEKRNRTLEEKERARDPGLR
jgi:uncharacterized phosphosugar-binding protein